MNKKGRMVRYVGIICWFLALFFLIQSAQEKRAAREAEETAKQAAIVDQIEENGDESGLESTIIFPED